jgi:hypothetical protein
LPTIATIIKKLAGAQTEFCRAADAIPPDQWTRKPKEDAWCAAEVVAHLVMVERAIVGGADRITQKVAHPAGLWKRLHLPMWLVEARVIRRKTPIPLDPTLIGGKEEMLGELRAIRERALAFLEETKNRDLSAYRWRHAFLGSLNVYEWFEMIAAHQVRHTKQIRGIGKRLPKVVGISQNQ